ncbi:MAG TPA: hypothetical protein VGG85_10195 [Terracidiphilus sp.]|jgi:hypothetical protein
MIIDPSGRLMRMPLALLEHSPFHSFLFPAFILLFANGILSLAIAIAVLRKVGGYALGVAFQGCVLAGWITIEVLMIRSIIWAHYVYWAIAVVLIVSGWTLTRTARTTSTGS